MQTHTRTVFARLVASRRAQLGFVLLAVLAFVAVFAELIAAPGPIALVGPRGVEILPVVLHENVYEGVLEDDIRQYHADDLAIWPLVRYGPTEPTDAGTLAPWSSEHPFGTDSQGRDLAARLVYGTRTALGLSLGAITLSTLLGVVLGGLAANDRGFWNDRLSRLVETVDTFPAIIVVALVRAIEREPTALSLVLAVAFVRWAEVARLVRAEALRANAEDYVLAARALGASPARIFARHVLRNAVGPVVVSSVFGVATVVLLEATIAFLAMGVPTRVASWGETLAEGALPGAPTSFLVLPGVALLVTVGASYLVADALRDAADPHTVRPSTAAH